ncbi:MAG: hypothetical protein OSJ72_09995 [Lachnospiraceae bacterium]|nr:hypothetical protein [Lachnospiraceae bacterium]
MKKSEFVEKFNLVYDDFLESDKVKEIFDSIENRSYTPTELIALTADISHQLTARFVFEILSQTIEFEEE